MTLAGSKNEFSVTVPPIMSKCFIYFNQPFIEQINIRGKVQTTVSVSLSTFLEKNNSGSNRRLPS